MTRDFSFARRPKWIAGHLIAVIAIVVFVNMGFWQLRRLSERQEFNTRLTVRTEAAAVDLGDAVAQYGLDPDELELRLVDAAGEYQTGEEVILLARSFNGVSGHHVLTPLYLDDDRALIVDRGWVPVDLGTPGLANHAAPTGAVTVRGVLRPTEVRGSFGPTIPPDGIVTQVPRVDLERLQQQISGELFPVYIQLVEQNPAQPGELPRLVPLPEPSEGPHRAYAVQWFLFAVVTAVGYPVLLRRTAEPSAQD